MRRGKKDFFFEKRSKKFLIIEPAPVGLARVQCVKVFWFLFSKKNCFLI